MDSAAVVLPNEVINALNATTLDPLTNTTAQPEAPNCTKAVLNAVIPIICVLVFMGTVVITYFIDDPGLKKLKRSTEKVEVSTIPEADRNYINYLAEHKMADHVKGHTFSSFSPGYTPYTLAIENDRRHLRRRACSESHTGRRMSDASSETQVILEHMLLTIGSGSTYTSLRNRAGFHVPFIHRRNKDETKPTDHPGKGTRNEETDVDHEQGEPKEENSTQHNES
ncbi:unnamed protein product [Echinostoma caproni]|uniref:DUF4808 domain-containing protein n=1 Tax=Echinostoma caproni TaxID=27848 RepID=A0A183AXU0_9TREM|nr:unnamed protein product [Echinostoma caproni]